MRILTVTFALALAGCPGTTPEPTGTTGDSGMDTDTPAPENARVRVMHLVPNVGLVDVFANDGEEPAFADADFTDGTDYAELAPGSYDFDVSADGEPATNPTLTLAADLAEGVSYAAVAHGYAGGDPAAALTAFVENSGDVPADTTRIHIVHAAADVGEVDIYNAADTSAPIAPDLAYGADAADIDLSPPGALTVGIDLDNDPATLEVTFDVPDLGAQYVSVYAVNRQAVDGDALDVALVAHTADGMTTVLEPNAAE